MSEFRFELTNSGLMTIVLGSEGRYLVLQLANTRYDIYVNRVNGRIPFSSCGRGTDSMGICFWEVRFE